MEIITLVNDKINNFVWVTIGLWLLIATGIIMSSVTGFFQVTHIGHWMKKTIGSVFKKSSHNKNEHGSVSQFQALCTALAATIGTGNIAGVAAAIVIGGPGAVFWMWVAAFFGMMTNFSENVLGIYYRRRNERNEWCGGAMYYLSEGLGAKKGCKQLGAGLAVLFSVFCLFASFGIGNMGQINSIAVNLNSVFGVPHIVSGIFLMAFAALVIVGGLKRIAAVTEKLVPFMALIYMVCAIIVCLFHIDQFGAVFTSIIKSAFGMRAVGGGIVGSGVAMAIQFGMKRGVFSNEAGLGSSVMVHSSSNVREPVVQGMWGIFEVFADTIIVCSVTAFAVLSSGLVDLETGKVISDQVSTALVAEAFSTVFGKFGSAFIAIAIIPFAFSTVLGWSQYGSKAFEYLFGRKTIKFYHVVFVAFIVVGATMDLTLAWDLSDTFNGLMAIPNLIGVLSLSGTVMRITHNYVQRKLMHKDVKPMLSALEDIQELHEIELNEMEALGNEATETA